MTRKARKRKARMLMATMTAQATRQPKETALVMATRLKAGTIQVVDIMVAMAELQAAKMVTMASTSQRQSSLIQDTERKWSEYSARPKK